MKLSDIEKQLWQCEQIGVDISVGAGAVGITKTPQGFKYGCGEDLDQDSQKLIEGKLEQFALIRHATFKRCAECGVWVTLVKLGRLNMIVTVDGLEHKCRVRK